VAIKATAAGGSWCGLRRWRASSLDNRLVGKRPVAGSPVEKALTIQLRNGPLGAAVGASPDKTG